MIARTDTPAFSSARGCGFECGCDIQVDSKVDQLSFGGICFRNENIVSTELDRTSTQPCSQLPDQFTSTVAVSRYTQ